MHRGENSGPGGENYDQSWMGWAFIRVILYALLIAAGLCWITSCSPRIVERIRYQRDTTYIVKRDSVRFYDRDSIFIREKGDTIYQYVEKWRWRDRVREDTIYLDRVDSVSVEKIKEVKVEQPLTWWQRFRQDAFWWLVFALFAALIYIFRKPIAALLKIV